MKICSVQSLQDVLGTLLLFSASSPIASLRYASASSLRSSVVQIPGEPLCCALLVSISVSSSTETIEQTSKQTQTQVRYGWQKNRSVRCVRCVLGFLMGIQAMRLIGTRPPKALELAEGILVIQPTRQAAAAVLGDTALCQTQKINISAGGWQVEGAMRTWSVAMFSVTFFPTSCSGTSHCQYVIPFVDFLWKGGEVKGCHSEFCASNC